METWVMQILEMAIDADEKTIGKNYVCREEIAGY
jgi:hypothetical protein